MRKYVCIGVGGFLGAVLRYGIKSGGIAAGFGTIPFTLWINLTGSFLLAFLSSAAFRAFRENENLRMGVTVGFLGAFTTFSTLCKEAGVLIGQGHAAAGLAYAAVSAAGGLACAYAGDRIAERFSRRTAKGGKI